MIYLVVHHTDNILLLVTPLSFELHANLWVQGCFMTFSCFSFVITFKYRKKIKSSIQNTTKEYILFVKIAIDNIFKINNFIIQKHGGIGERKLDCKCYNQVTEFRNEPNKSIETRR